MKCLHCGEECAATEPLSTCPSCLKPLASGVTAATGRTQEQCSPVPDAIAPATAHPPTEEAPRPLGVSVVVVLYSVVAVCQLVFGLVLVTGGWPPAEGTQLMGRAVFVLIGIILVSMDVATLMSGYYLWHGFDWARSAFMVFVALGGLLQISKALRAEVLPMLQVAVSVLFLLVLNSAGAKGYCTRTALRGAMPVVAVAAVGVLAFGGFAVLYFVRMS